MQGHFAMVTVTVPLVLPRLWGNAGAFCNGHSNSSTSPSQAMGIRGILQWAQ